MIVIPRVLAGLLRDVEGVHAKVLSLAFAERALRSCVEVLAPAHLDLSLAYIAAAGDYVNGVRGIDALGRSHVEYFAVRDGVNAQSERVMWVAALAVFAACQRDMEKAGIVVKDRNVPDLVAVAKEAQDAVVSCAVASDPSSAGEHVSAFRQRVRWAEARWQLMRVIETAPVPPGGPHAGHLDRGQGWSAGDTQQRATSGDA